MKFAETPVQVIKSSIDQFVFACFLQDAVTQGLITPNSFRKEIRLDEGGRGVDFQATYILEQLQAYTSNLTRMALGNTAIATHKALEVLFGPVDPTETSPTGSARVILYQVRCAFAHDPLNPVWTPKVNQYDRTYKVTVKVTRSSGELATSREIGFHPPSLKNKHLAADDFGGLGGYLGLLHYFLAVAEGHSKGHEPYPPSVDES